MTNLVLTKVSGDVSTINGAEHLAHDLTGEQTDPAVLAQQMTLHIIWKRKKNKSIVSR